ncbi:MAG: pyruvate, phosphate dikinase [Candidatus Thermoplasmatota archaeon]|nr:pyruvate, phosphate dikinase [Candidatus Thermoplasmatota archaeon]
MRRFVYSFQEGVGRDRAILGGKGFGLAEMTGLGLPVPPGFTITTAACRAYLESEKLPAGLKDEVSTNLQALEEATGRRFGDPVNPLLVSVRSGAPISMPGMMDTVLNLGLNDETVKGLAHQTGNETFALNSYRRLLSMFGDTVAGIHRSRFEEHLERVKAAAGLKDDTELDADAWREVVAAYEAVLDAEGQRVPQDPHDQLWEAISAVFRSWNSDRAVKYRAEIGIPEDLGTAVNVQAMVFGNRGDHSGTGVAFTRDPATGTRALYGEYLLNAQGEDVVAGIRTPQPIRRLQEDMPSIFGEFSQIAERLENHFRDVQDIEFTIEEGRLFILQTRTGQRAAGAAVKVAVDMVEEGLISPEEAVRRVSPEQVEQLLHRQIDPTAELEVLATGLNASPGAAVGSVTFDPTEAEEAASAGEAVILVRLETTPDDIHGIVAAQGVLTGRGGRTSHAAIVTRGMGKPCVAGCEALRIDYGARTFSVGDRVVRQGDLLTIDGTTGRVFLGEAPLVEPEMTEEFRSLLKMADAVRRLGVRANADTPEDAARARELGAEGIGLCRTEHMFMQADRLPIMQAMILATSREERLQALDQLLPHQRDDFVAILKEMEGLPVTIRLLDPPLHEFLPRFEELLVEVTELRHERGEEQKLRAKEALLERVAALREINPMLGLRGCRLGLLYPEINEMQVRAILEAASELGKQGYEVFPEIMIPLVGHPNELLRVKEDLERVAQDVMEEQGAEVSYAFGTMIEVPRGALVADEIAQEAEFFSFGTNDLTQTTYGFSRDDAEGKFLVRYLEDGYILEENPFEVLDEKGVGELMRIAVERGRATRPDLKIGICGEHGGEPRSIGLCHRLGLDYVSCSPFRIPVARLAAAHAALEEIDET